jgi:hypothetical protein
MTVRRGATSTGRSSGEVTRSYVVCEFLLSRLTCELLFLFAMHFCLSVKFGCHAFQLSPSTLPQEVIHQQLQALQKDDMATVYQCASPGNKERTGDVTRFGEMVRFGPYKHLIEHQKSIILLESTMASSQQFLVKIVPKNYEKSGRIFEYWWSLSRCMEGEYAGSYMVDAVIPNQ